MSEETNIVRAEGRHAARANQMVASNPYPVSSMFHSHWEDGFFMGLLDVRDELKIMRQHLKNSHEENTELKKQIEALTVTEEEE